MNKENYYPKRIICLTEETTETLYLLGEQDRIIGISGFTMRPKIARKEKPKVCTFIDANINYIIELKPDLVIGFSDIQADIAKQLIKNGVTVWVNNYRSISGIKKMIMQLGMLVGQKEKSLTIINNINLKIQKIQNTIYKWNTKPKVYFEEWDEPMISGIKWVSQIIEICGGINIFPELSNKSLAKDRIIKSSNNLIAKNPDIILVSWCGKKMKKEKILARKNWSQINAIKNQRIYEIKSDVILQPGPAALTEGINIIHDIFMNWHNENQV